MRISSAPQVAVSLDFALQNKDLRDTGAGIRRLLRGDLDPPRSRELLAEMRSAGLPT